MGFFNFCCFAISLPFFFEYAKKMACSQNNTMAGKALFNLPRHFYRFPGSHGYFL